MESKGLGFQFLVGEPDFSPLFHACVQTNTVEPVLSSRLSKSRNLYSTSVKRSPVLSGCGHPLLSPNGLFVLYLTWTERSLKVRPLR